MKEKVKRFVKGYFIVAIIYELILIIGIIVGTFVKMIKDGASFKTGILEMSEAYVCFAQKVAMKMATFYSSLL